MKFKLNTAGYYPFSFHIYVANVILGKIGIEKFDIRKKVFIEKHG